MQKIFETKDEMAEAISKIVSTQEISECYINEIALTQGAPIITAMRAASGELPIEDGELEGALAEDVMAKLPFNGKLSEFPVGSTAFKSLQDRAKLYGKTVQDHPLVLNEGFGYYKETAKTLVQGGVLFAVHSKEYSFLSQDELLNALFDYFGENLEFVYGTYSPELTCLKAEIDVPGWRFPEYKPGVIFTTNDIAACGANVHAGVTVKKTGVFVGLGDKLSTTHSGGASVSDFADKLKDVFALVTDATKRLEELKKIEIRHPDSVFAQLVREFSLPRREATQALEDMMMRLGVKTTAYDVFMYLWDIIPLTKERKTGITETAKLGIEENISRVVRFKNWKQIDVPYAI